jgi:D-alanyl-D-alanine carboxypeptidase
MTPSTLRLIGASFTLACALTAGAQSPNRAALVTRLDSIAGAAVRGGNVAGMAVAVVKGRDTLLMKGYGFSDLENKIAVTPQTVFRIGSVTKQFTSAAIMKLVEEGKLSLDDDITKYGLNFPTHGRKILLRHLLNHTSGIPSYTDVGPRFGTVMRMDLTTDSLIGVIRKDSLQFEPGRYFYYNNTGYFMLGMIIEKITGKRYGDDLDERFFKPNAMSGSTYCDTRKLIPNRAQGYERDQSGFVNSAFLSMNLPYAAGSLCSTVGDLVAWSTRLHSGRIVSPASFREMTTPMKLASGRPMNYGFGLTVDTMGTHRVVSHGGGINGFISSLVHLPDDSLTVAVLANTAPAPADATADALARAVVGVPRRVPAPPKDLPTTVEDRAKLVGNYALTRPDGSKVPFRVFEENGALMIQAEGGQSVRLAHQGDNVWTGRGPGRVAFDVVNGKAVGFQQGGGARALEAVRLP